MRLRRYVDRRVRMSVGVWVRVGMRMGVLVCLILPVGMPMGVRVGVIMGMSVILSWGVRRRFIVRVRVGMGVGVRMSVRMRPGARVPVAEHNPDLPSPDAVAHHGLAFDTKGIRQHRAQHRGDGLEIGAQIRERRQEHIAGCAAYTVNT